MFAKYKNKILAYYKTKYPNKKVNAKNIKKKLSPKSYTQKRSKKKISKKCSTPPP
jgi:hypothetical protein